MSAAFSSFYFSSIKKGTPVGSPMTANYTNFLWTWSKHRFWMISTKSSKETLNMATFYWCHILYLGKQWRLVEIIFKILLEIQGKKIIWSSVIKFDISQSTKMINFLDVCSTLNEQILSATVFSRPIGTHIYLNAKSL